MEDEPEIKEACGVFGIYAPEIEVASSIGLALIALQHRGQESCGITTTNLSGKFYSHKGMGLVSQVFNSEDVFSPLKGGLGVGHTRYSTAGKPTIDHAQPVTVDTFHGKLSIAQNGNLSTHRTLRKKLLQKGIGMFKESDIEVIAQILSSTEDKETNGPNWETRISSFMHQADGAYSLCIMTEKAVFGCRDHLGIRPLCIGSLETKTVTGEIKTRYVLASESCAFFIIGATYLREVLPGEIVRLDEKGISSTIGRDPKPHFCIFEYVYFARPDSLLENQLVVSVRERLGIQLAKESPADADIVVGVPESAVPAALGYSKYSKIPIKEGLMKNRYVHRTFIQPTQTLRKLGVSMKFTPVPENLKGKKIVLIDDSIVRGNTTQNLVRLLFEAGALEVHVRVTSPPVVSPCFMGIDMATTDQMIAFNKTEDQICKEIGATSLKYLSITGLSTAVAEGIKGDGSQYCGACFTGKYPLPVDDW